MRLNNEELSTEAIRVLTRSFSRPPKDSDQQADLITCVSSVDLRVHPFGVKTIVSLSGTHED